jgi:hypothetical protein
MSVMAFQETSEPSPKPTEPKGGAPPSGPFWMLALVGLLFVAVVLPRLRRRRPAASEGLGTFDPARRDPRHELENLLNDIQDLSREQIARLDTKIRMLNQLLVECDQKKRELEELIRRSGASAPAPGMPDPAPPAPPARPANPLHEQVYALQDSGRELQEICGATGLEKGEVELILGLRRMPPGGA